FCGEPLLPEHVESIFQVVPTAIIQNAYGPTETTITMTQLTLTAENYRPFCGTSISIGPPIPGMTLDLVGGSHPDEGEIVVSGPQLADGYWLDQDKTRQKFRRTSDSTVRRVEYFTGDWAERQNGNIFFKDRMDFQVKIRGYRIELDEISA